MKLTFTPLPAQISYLQKIAIVIIFIFSSSAMFAQGNSGNSNGNGPGNLPTKGPGKLPFWNLNGNPGDSSYFIGTTNNFPVSVKVNNIQRASFTNNGMELAGNFHSTFASVDSIINSWKIIVDVLETKTINAEQYFQNDTLVDLVGMQSAIGNLASAQAGQQSAVDSLESAVGNLSDTVSDLKSQISNLIGTVDTVVLNTVQVNEIITQSISSDTIYLSGAIIADTVKIPNELKLGDHSLYISGLKTGDPNSANRIYSKEDDLLFQSVAGNNYNTIINSGNTGNVGIGTISPSEKLTVEGNLSVSGGISANTFNAEKFSSDTLFVTRILPAVGDSEIHIGESSITINNYTNRISSGQTSFFLNFPKGLSLGNKHPSNNFSLIYPAHAWAENSIAIGQFVGNSSGANNSIVIGSGDLAWGSGQLINDKPNSLMIGFNSAKPTLFVGSSNGQNTTGNVGIGTSDPKTALHVYKNDGALSLEGSDHVYMQFYPMGFGAGRKAWLGFGTSQTKIFTLQNQITDGSIHLTSPTTYINGNLGIGTAAPLAKLNVLSNGSTVLTDFTEGITKASILITSGYTGQTPDNYLPGIFWSNNNISQNLPKAGIWVKQNGGTDIYFGTSSDYTQGLNSRVVIDQRGNVGIGTTAPQAKLQVNVTSDADIAFAVYNGSTEQFRIMGDGKFYGRGYKIKLGNFPDYVYDKNYKRMTQDEKEKYFDEFKRMPYMPSAAEIEKDGLDVGDGLIGITRNVEENSLDINDLFKLNAELFKRVEKLEIANKEKEEKIKMLEKEIKTIKK